MAGIYIHIPFCKQACSYCNFHFSTSMKWKPAMVDALCTEIDMRTQVAGFNEVSSVYFGGGTPSLLSAEEISRIYDRIDAQFTITEQAEVTLECNPDDITPAWLQKIRNTPVNRISLGVQSFDDDQLVLMHRAHNSDQAIRSLDLLSSSGDFDLSVDLIYGIPYGPDEVWLAALERIGHYLPSHLSCYALTIEPNTLLAYQIKQGLLLAPPDEHQSRQYDLLMNWADAAGYEHYEISNFARPGKRARHNSAYWTGDPYLGVGPSAHSLLGNQRSWNVKNNAIYLREINNGDLPETVETLSQTDIYNEYIMTGLRTSAGVTLDNIRQLGSVFVQHFLTEADALLSRNLLFEYSPGNYRLTREGKHLADGVAASLFLVNED